MTDDYPDLIARLTDIVEEETGYDVRIQAADALTHLSQQVSGLIEQHARDSAELRRLCGERDFERDLRASFAVELKEARIEIAAKDSRIAALESQLAARESAEPVAERIIHAIEGECDGLAITAEQASNILAYLQYGATMNEAQAIQRDAERYRKLRAADINAIHKGGVFVGLTPDNVVINGEDLDIAVDLLIDAALASQKEQKE